MSPQLNTLAGTVVVSVFLVSAIAFAAPFMGIEHGSLVFSSAIAGNALMVASSSGLPGSAASGTSSQVPLGGLKPRNENRCCGLRIVILAAFVWLCRSR